MRMLHPALSQICYVFVAYHSVREYGTLKLFYTTFHYLLYCFVALLLVVCRRCLVAALLMHLN